MVLISFGTGSMSKDEIEAIFEALPVDIIFADKEDIVTYFNRLDRRIFACNKDIIGKKIQACHKLQGADKINALLADFKSGKRNAAEFHVDNNGHEISVRYFAVRREKEYVGCLEVSQDVSDLKKK